MNKIKSGVILGLLLSLNSAFAQISPETAVNILQRLEVLEKQARELNGENEVLKNQIEQLKKSQKQGFLGIDERLEELANAENDTKPEPAKVEAQATEVEDAKVKIINGTEPEAAVEPDAEPKAEEAKADVESATEKAIETAEKSEKPKKIRAPNSYEKETYQAAFSLMKTSPTAATKAFQEYIKMQPDSPLAANAQYWIGEVMYSHNNYKGAVQEFIKVLQNYKYSDKAPDAAIKLGYSFYALKNWAYARRTFDDVIKYFPENKNAVTLAQKRLDQMTAAGN